jgi:hypothetical protein
MTLEKRGNQEIEVRCVVPGSSYIMILPGSDEAVPYDGRFDKSGPGFEKTASLKAGESTYFES